jgi:hypothetical protein
MTRLLALFFAATVFSCQNNNGKTVVKHSLFVKPQTAGADTPQKLKFAIPIKYEQFKVDTFTGRPAKINYSSSKTARRFRSALKWSIQTFGTNFAGHYNLSEWGCGTNCLNGAITDLKTGDVYDIPTATLNYEYKPDSKLLVINPPDSSGYYDDSFYCLPELWEWKDNKKKFKKLN